MERPRTSEVQPLHFYLALGPIGASDRGSAPAHRSVGASAETIEVAIEQGEVVFHLNPVTLHQIVQAQNQGLSLHIPKSLQVALVKTSFLDEIEIGHRRRYKVVCLQSGLTFQTCWHETLRLTKTADPGTRVARTIISLDGDILNQVAQVCLDHPYGSGMVAAHYWLMHQLLQRQRSNLARYVSTIVWAVPLLCVGGTVVTNIGALMVSAGLYQGITNILMSFSSFIVPIGWDLIQDRVLPVVQIGVKRWVWKQLIRPQGLFRNLAARLLGLT